MPVTASAPLSGPQQAKLHAALLTAFTTRFDVEQFMKYSLDENLNRIVADVGLSEVLFRVIEWANANGRTTAFITAVHQQFRDNGAIQEIATELSCVCPVPQPPGSGKAAPKPVNLTDGLAALQQLMQDVDVRDAVGDFQADFKSAASQVEMLGLYKDLHDLLHTLQFQCYKGIAQEAKRFPDDDTSHDILSDYELTLNNLVAQVQDVGARPAATAVDLRWVQDLRDASAALHQALQQGLAKPLTQTLWLMDRVLAVQPSQINTRLNTAARALRLGELVTALTLIHDRLTGVSNDQAKLQAFSDGTEALRGLQQTLLGLLVEHDRWQALDLDLRRIQMNLRSNMLELELSWDRLKIMIDPLLQAQEPWAVDLRSTCEALGQAVAAQDAARERQAFQRLYSQAADRFYRVDTSLKRVCENLRTITEPLNTLLRILK